MVMQVGLHFIRIFWEEMKQTLEICFLVYCDSSMQKAALTKKFKRERKKSEKFWFSFEQSNLIEKDDQKRYSLYK